MSESKDSSQINSKELKETQARALSFIRRFSSPNSSISSSIDINDLPGDKSSGEDEIIDEQRDERNAHLVMLKKIREELNAMKMPPIIHRSPFNADSIEMTDISSGPSNPTD